jgi:hypothetical protein
MKKQSQDTNRVSINLTEKEYSTMKHIRPRKMGLESKGRALPEPKVKKMKNEIRLDRVKKKIDIEL